MREWAFGFASFEGVIRKTREVINSEAQNARKRGENRLEQKTSTITKIITRNSNHSANWGCKTQENSRKRTFIVKNKTKLGIKWIKKNWIPLKLKLKNKLIKNSETSTSSVEWIRNILNWFPLKGFGLGFLEINSYTLVNGLIWKSCPADYFTIVIKTFRNAFLHGFVFITNVELVHSELGVGLSDEWLINKLAKSKLSGLNWLIKSELTEIWLIKSNLGPKLRK
jgi:hypothetical protein